VSLKEFEIDGYPLMAYEKDGKTYTWLAGCPHKKRPILSKGYEIIGDNIKCPFHNAVFSLITGEMIKEPESKTPCINCVLIKAEIRGNQVIFDRDPFIPELPKH